MYLVSPSQIKTFLGCEKQWEYDKLVMLPRIDHPWFVFGHEAHSLLENYVDGNVPDPEADRGQQGVILRSCIKEGLLPPKGTPTEYLAAQSITPRVIVQARADWLWAHPNGYDLVGDYKTTSKDVSEWVHKSLAEDVQANINSWLAYQAGSKEVRCRWIYCHKKRKTKRVTWAHEAADELMPRDRVRQFMWDVVVPAANKITEYRDLWQERGPTAKANPKACDKWNSFRCDFSKPCFDSLLSVG